MPRRRLAYAFPTLTVLVALAILGAAAGQFGSVVRQESSPWIWRALQDPRHVRGFADAAIAIGSYLAMYAMGFMIPYVGTLALISLPILAGASEGERRHLAITPARHASALVIGLSGFVASMILLEPIAAFWRAVPWGLWNGWALVLCVGLAGLLFVAAVVRLANEHVRIAESHGAPDRNYARRDPRRTAADN